MPFEIGNRIAIFSPGQGISPPIDWVSVDGACDVLSQIQSVLSENVDVEKLLNTSPRDREISALNAHLLLTAVFGIAANQINSQLGDRLVAVSGHSAGLPNSLGMTNFYKEGVTGSARVMARRGTLLTMEQSKNGNAGKMYAVSWSGNEGFKRLGEWVLERNEKIKQRHDHEGIWVACWNYQTDKSSQIVVTTRKEEGADMEEMEKTFPENIKRITELPIALGAHSPLVLGAVSEFSVFLQEQITAGNIQELPENGVVYVSDHIQSDSDDPLISQDSQEIAADLAQFNLPVQFQRTIKYMMEKLDITTFVEIGGDVLGGLIKGMDLGIVPISIATPQKLDEFVTALANRS